MQIYINSRSLSDDQYALPLGQVWRDREIGSGRSVISRPNAESNLNRLPALQGISVSHAHMAGLNGGRVDLPSSERLRKIAVSAGRYSRGYGCG